MFELLKEKRACRYMGGYAVSVFGTGFVYPLTAIYLDSVVGAATSEISLYFFLTGVCSFAIAPLSGMLSDRIGCESVGMGGIAFQALGSQLIAISSNFIVAVIGGMILGIGNGAFYGSQTSLLFRLFGKERLSKVFAIQYIVMNVAVAASGVAGGFVASTFGSAGFRTCYLFNSFSFIVYGTVLLHDLGRPQTEKREAKRDGESGEAGTNVLVILRGVICTSFFKRVMLPLAIIQFIFAGFGFSQMDSVMPLVFVKYGSFDVGVAGLFLSSNCIAVVFFQARAEKYVEQFGKKNALALAAAIWCFASIFAVLAVIVFPNSLIGVLLICLYSIVFGVGETFVSPSVQPMIAECAPEGCLGFCSATVNTMYSLGTTIGPALALGMLTSHSCSGIWLTIFPMLMIGALCARLVLKEEGCEAKMVR